MASARVATSAYVPPLATAAPSPASGTPTQPSLTGSTDQPGNTNIYLYYFIVPYLDAHVLSPPSWRYAYMFWIVLSGLLVGWTACHQFAKHASSAHWLPGQRRSASAPSRPCLATRLARSIAIRRLVSSPPSNKSLRWYASSLLTLGQLAVLAAFAAILLAVSLVGDDYISPTTCTWGGTCPVQVFNQGPPKSSFAPLRIRRRDAPSSPFPPQSAEKLLVARSTSSTPAHIHPQRLFARASALSLNPNGWAPFNDPLLAAPNYDVPRNMWTISSRFGLIAYAMLPLIVILGLKSWPFNVFATPWLTNYGFDKAAILHRWIGRLIWIWSTIHTVTFTVQLCRDYNPYGRLLITDVWQYYRFNWGVVAYIALTLIVGLSFNPFRDRYYELFYFSHVVLSILCLVGCIVHYEPLWAWAVIALSLWGAERAVRISQWLFINGLLSPHIGPTRFWSSKPSGTGLQQPSPDLTIRPPERISLFAYGFGPLESTLAPYSLSYPPASSTTPTFPPPNSFNRFFRLPAPLHIPHGFALAQLLPGETVRLTLRPVQPRTVWSAGQYVLVCLPTVSWWQTHPYTIANSCLLSAEKMVLIVRARGGLTRELYAQLSAADGRKNVLMRCCVSQPLGSASRIRWEAFESVVIVCGGSGISFGIGLLEEIVAGVAGSDKTCVQRIRFVWILRDHAHLTWVASAMKRCLLMLTPDQIRVDLYVSSTSTTAQQAERLESFNNKEAGKFEKLEGLGHQEDADSYLLSPPQAPFRRHHDLKSSSSSELATASSNDRELFLSSPTPSLLPELNNSLSASAVGLASSAELGDDLTEFEGERQARTSLDEILSATVRVEGKRRRRATLSRRKHHLSKRESLHENQEDDATVWNSASTPAPGKHESHLSHQGFLANGEEVRLELDEEEKIDLEDLAEIVRTGKPDLGEILDCEIAKSIGQTIVACCGPGRLSGIVRGLVADKVRDGKNLEIWTEDFSY